MANTITIGKLSEITDGEMKTVRVGERKFALLRIGDEVFAVDDTCSHERCSLGTDGFLDGETIICGCHGATFEAKTGKALTLPATENVHAYQVIVEEDEIKLTI